MSRLRIFDEANPSAPLSSTEDLATIAERLRAIGVRFEQWQAEGSLDMAQRANALWKRQLNEYVPPPLDPAVDEALLGVPPARAPVRLKVPQVALDVGP